MHVLKKYRFLLKNTGLWASKYRFVFPEVGMSEVRFKCCVTILLYGCESWVLSQNMESKINSFATSCYKIMLDVKRKDHVSNTVIYIP